MFFVAILLHSLTISFKAITKAYPGKNNESSRHLISSIVNGVPAFNRPFYASLKYLETDEFICGATVVQSSWVLTAASCVDFDGKNSGS